MEKIIKSQLLDSSQLKIKVSEKLAVQIAEMCKIIIESLSNIRIPPVYWTGGLLSQTTIGWNPECAQEPLIKT